MDRPSVMQALQMRAVGELALAELPVPAPGLQEILIRTLAATICTSDLHDLARNPFGLQCLSDPELALHEIVTHTLPFEFVHQTRFT